MTDAKLAEIYRKAARLDAYVGAVGAAGPSRHRDGLRAVFEAGRSAGRSDGITGDSSDGYHTFNELYEFRLLYNAALFNEWAAQGEYDVHKSWHHADDPDAPIFDGGWFVVVAQLPSGQISNHYEAKDWDLFRVSEWPVAAPWDKHTAQDVAVRLRALLTSEGESKQDYTLKDLSVSPEERARIMPEGH